jgi:hypothetical protein
VLQIVCIRSGLRILDRKGAEVDLLDEELDARQMNMLVWAMRRPFMHDAFGRS